MIESTFSVWVWVWPMILCIGMAGVALYSRKEDKRLGLAVFNKIQIATSIIFMFICLYLCAWDHDRHTKSGTEICTRVIIGNNVIACDRWEEK